MSGFFIGIDVGGTNLKAGLVNDEGSILAMEKRKIAEVSDQKALVEALVALTQSLTERGGLMEIKYSIAVEHVVTGRNCFKIRVRAK